MIPNVVNGSIQLRFEVAVVIFAKDDFVGGVADAFPDFSADLRLERGGIDVVSLIQTTVPERTTVVKVNAL